MLSPQMIRPRSHGRAWFIMTALLVAIASAGVGATYERRMAEHPTGDMPFDLDLAPASGASANLAVFDGTNAVTDLSVIGSATLNYESHLGLDPHHVDDVSGARPRLDSCGLGAWLADGSSDSGGTIHVGADSVGCRIEFGKSWSSAPHCVAVPNRPAEMLVTAREDSLEMSHVPDGADVDYLCTAL